jgi:hypothetical protein
VVAPPVRSESPVVFVRRQPAGKEAVDGDIEVEDSLVHEAQY